MTRKLMMAVAAAMAFGARAETETVGGYEWTYQINGVTAEISGVSPSTGAVTIPSTLGGKPVTSIGEYAFYNCSGLTSVTIPDSVTSIGDYAFVYCDGLASVTIGNSVTSIGYEAFYYCSRLTSVTIPDSVTSVGDYAFAYCDGLASVTIGNSVTSIGNRAFFGCSGLTSVTIRQTVFSRLSMVFPSSYQNITNVDILGDVTSIGNSAFSGCSGLTSVTIPDGVTSIGTSAFYGCSRLTSVTIPDGVTSIGKLAFSGCSGLASVTIPDGVTSIGDNAFYGCSGLTSVTIPNSVTNIGWSAFSGCSGLASVTIPNSVTSIGNSAFSGCSGLTSVTIPNSVTSIGTFAFSGCSGLTSVTIPDGVTSIRDYTFSGCSGLTSVTIHSSVTGVGQSAFSGCTSVTSLVASFAPNGVDKTRLTRVTIPKGVTSIRNSAFSGCSGLTSVTISDGVTSIGNSAFSGCNGLASVTIPDSVIDIGERAFSGCEKLTSVAIPRNVTSIGAGVFERCASLHEISVPFIGAAAFTNIYATSALPEFNPRGTFHHFFGDQPYEDMLPITLSYTTGSSYTSYFPKRLKKVNILCCDHQGALLKGAFYGCSFLEEVIIPDGVRIIDNQAFRNCSGLKQIEIPTSVIWIGNNAFAGCINLSEVNFVKSSKLDISASVLAPGKASVVGDRILAPSDYAMSFSSEHKEYCAIFHGAFADCRSLSIFKWPNYMFTYQDSEASIFSGCNLRKLILPAGLKPNRFHYTFQSDIPYDYWGSLIPEPDPVNGYYSDAAYEVLLTESFGQFKDCVTFYEGQMYYPSREGIELGEDSNSASISKVVALQHGDSRYVDIYYDLDGTGGGTWNVSLKLFADGRDLGAKTFSGAVGAGVAPGRNRCVTWDAGADWPDTIGDLVAVVTAGDSSAESRPFAVDTRRKGFGIEDVSSAYCSGLYGGVGGRRATFLSDISCEVSFTVMFADDEPDIDRLMVNGIAFPAEPHADGMRHFRFDMGSLASGSKLDVVAVRKDGTESAPFRVNVEIAAPPPMWGAWQSRVLTDKSSVGSVEYYTVGLNTVWLWDRIANGIEFAVPGLELDAFVEMIPQLRLWETFDSATGQYRIGALGGIKGDALKKLIDKESYQSFGDFVGKELGFELGEGPKAELDIVGRVGGGIVYEWDAEAQKWNHAGGDIRGRLTLDGAISLTDFNGGGNRLAIDSSVGENVVNALRLLRAKLEVGATVVSGELVIRDVNGKLSCDFALDPLLDLYANAACNSLSLNGFFSANAGLVLRGESPEEGGTSLLTKWGYRANTSLRATLLGYELVDYSRSWDHWWIDRTTRRLSAARLSAAPNGGVSAGFQLMGRDYDDYPNPAPSLTANGVGDVLLSLRDNPARTAVNRTEVLYRAGVSNSWDSAASVWDDGTADFTPTVSVAPGGTVFAAWANAKRELADSDPLETMCAAMEIAVGVRDAATGAWTCRNLTDDTALDMNPVLRAASDGSAAVAWVRNGAGLFVGSAEKPSSVMLSTFRGGVWSEPEKVAEVGALLSIDLAWNGETAEVVWSKDGDGDLETPDDREAWGVTVAGGIVGTATRISAGGVDAACPHVWFGPDGMARKVWLAGGVLTADGGVAIAGADGLDVSENFALLPRPDGGASLVWWRMGKGGIGGELVAATYSATSRAVGDAMVVGGSSETQERTVVGVVGDDGALRLAYESVSVSTNAAGGVEFGTVELKTGRREAGVDLGVAKVSFGGDVEVDTMVDVRVTVSNGGCAEAKNVDVWLWFGVGEGKSLVSVATTNVLPLSSATVSIPWQMGKGMTNTAFTVEVDPQEMIADTERTNNAFVWKPDLGLPRLSFRNVRCVNVSDTVRLVGATVRNDGLVPLEVGAVLKFWRGEIGGELLGTDTLGLVAAGGEWDAGIEVDVSQISNFADHERVVVELEAGVPHPTISVTVARELASVPEAEIDPVVPQQMWTVTFDARGGNVAEKARSVTNGHAVGELPEAVWDGHAFNGWFTDPDVGSLVSEDTDVTTNVTFYAHWTVVVTPESEPVNPSPVEPSQEESAPVKPVPSQEEPAASPMPELWPEATGGAVRGSVPASAASSFAGFLSGAAGDVAGTVLVKVAKPKNGAAKATVTIQPVGGRKTVVNGALDVATGKVSGIDLTLGADGMSGTWNGYAISGSRNLFSSKNKAKQGAANGVLNAWKGAVNVAWEGAKGWNGLSVSIAAKGKAKVTGALADGTKVTASGQLVVGEEWCCVPVVAAKAKLAFAIWLPLAQGAAPVVAGLGPGAVVGRAGSLVSGAAFRIDAEAAASAFGGAMARYLPDGVAVAQGGARWTVAGGAKAGKVAMKNGVVDDSGAGANPSALKLSYTAKSGAFKGSFKAYAVANGKLKAAVVNVAGVMIGGKGYGAATVKKRGGVPVTVE